MLPLLIVTTVLAQSKPPDFGAFPAPETAKSKPAAVILSSKRQRQFRTVIREGAAKGPNFAGHYTVVTWGCGAGCVQMVIADASTGRLYDPPFEVLSLPIGFAFEDGEPGVEYRPGSRLIKVRGCPEEDTAACASYSYEWTGSQLKLVHSKAASKQ